MGGMISGAETLTSALKRETWEVASLRLRNLRNVVRGGHIDIRRPSNNGHGAGYVIERINWYQCSMQHGVMPVNQDGEVEQFVWMDAGEMPEKMDTH